MFQTSPVLRDYKWVGKSNHLISNLFSNYRRQARLRSIEFKISKAQFQRLLFLDCYICGQGPSNRRVSRSGVFLIYNGIDRVDNKRGYVRGNVKPCCMRCNQIKCRMDLPTLQLHLKRMLKGLKGVA